MSFGWGPSKSERDARERGLPFEIALALFDRNTIEFDDTLKNHREPRIVVYGEVAGRVLVCVYTWRAIAERPIRWIINLYMANRGDANAYRNTFPE
jgi:uncharacterized protein